jgi:hypothetical protein
VLVEEERVLEEEDDEDEALGVDAADDDEDADTDTDAAVPLARGDDTLLADICLTMLSEGMSPISNRCSLNSASVKASVTTAEGATHSSSRSSAIEQLELELVE